MFNSVSVIHLPDFGMKWLVGIFLSLSSPETITISWSWIPCVAHKRIVRSMSDSLLELNGASCFGAFRGIHRIHIVHLLLYCRRLHQTIIMYNFKFVAGCWFLLLSQYFLYLIINCHVSVLGVVAGCVLVFKEKPFLRSSEHRLGLSMRGGV